MELRESEYLERRIDHQKGVPMRLNDWIRVPLLFGFVIQGVFMIVMYFNSRKNLMEIYTLFFGIYAICMSIYYLYKLLYLRKKQLMTQVYLLTNQRLIIYDEKANKTLQSFEYTDFPAFTYYESPYNYGYIVVGEVEPAITGSNSFSLKQGVNLEDHQIVLENLSQVKKEYDFLKAKVEEFNKATE